MNHNGMNMQSNLQSQTSPAQVSGKIHVIDFRFNNFFPRFFPIQTSWITFTWRTAFRTTPSTNSRCQCRRFHLPVSSREIATAKRRNSSTKLTNTHTHNRHSPTKLKVFLFFKFTIYIKIYIRFFDRSL